MPSTRKTCDMKILADTMRRCVEGTFAPDIDGAKYGFCIYENGKCEIFDTVEDDDYRIEKFDTVESALNEFIINDNPIVDYISDVVPGGKR